MEEIVATKDAEIADKDARLAKMEALLLTLQASRSSGGSNTNLR